MDGRILILKGPTSIIVTSSKNIFLVNNGTPALASAGTGDVLSGILVALAGRGSILDDVALLGSYLHGECAQLYNELFSSDGLTASLLPDIIPLAMESAKDVH